jgi:hypothetical protein
LSRCAPLAALCVDAASFVLSGGLPAGGSYSGSGVAAGSFDPSSGYMLVLERMQSPIPIPMQTDARTLLAVQNIVVNDLPLVTLAPLAAVCVDAASFVLSGGLPAGGSYSGTGVAAGSFDPSVAGAGTHAITYTYTMETAAQTQLSQNITVNDLPVVTLAPLQRSVLMQPVLFFLADYRPAEATPEAVLQLEALIRLQPALEHTLSLIPIAMQTDVQTQQYKISQ